MFENIKLRFTTEQWPINQLVQLYEAERINLSPHYQRNSIWSLSNQRSLIATVTLGNPLPTFFVRTMPRNKFEMVDGQQRSRSIIGYWNGEFADNKHVTLSSGYKGGPPQRQSI
jgi:hypothetical protein